MADIEVESAETGQRFPNDELKQTGIETRRIKPSTLLDHLNYLHFQGGSICAQFRAKDRGPLVYVDAYPDPYGGELLTCRWIKPIGHRESFRDLELADLIIDTGFDLLSVRAEVVRLDAEGGDFRIPDTVESVGVRKFPRFSCSSIDARLIQNGFAVEGQLNEFSAISCRIAFKRENFAAIEGFNAHEPVFLILQKSGRIAFSGSGSILRVVRTPSAAVVVTLDERTIHRHAPKKYRSVRHALYPAPIVAFTHPLSGAALRFDAVDISGSGVAIEEAPMSATLMSGLIIPDAAIRIGARSEFRCAIQVLYRTVVPSEHGEGVNRYGLVFLDMDPRDQIELADVLHRNIDPRRRVSCSVEPDQLWRFFFDSGFIYPAKYRSLETFKEEFKRTYERLYAQPLSITRHFLFIDRGRLYAHMAMLRCNAKTWLIHHHASARSGYGTAGVAVLEQIGQYINEFHRHPSTNLEYILCYYRKENRFPARVFGGVVRDIRNEKGASLDTFAYAAPEDFSAAATNLPFQVFPANGADLQRLRDSYERASGGLALDALNLAPEQEQETELNASYAHDGFFRERQLLALQREGTTVAVLSVTRTDRALNLSNLTSTIQAFVIDRERCDIGAFSAAVLSISTRLEREDLKVLVYPPEYLEENGITYDKKYILWVLNLRYLDGYFDSLRNTFKRDVYGKPGQRIADK